MARASYSATSASLFLHFTEMGGPVGCDGVGVILLQTIEGPDTIYRWAEICQTD